MLIFSVSHLKTSCLERNSEAPKGWFRVEMDGDSGSEPKSPLLSKSDGWRFSESRRRGRLSRRNSSNSLRNEFVSRLPEKIRSGIDVESPSHLDLSKSKGLSEGVVLCVCLSLLAEKPKEKGGKLSVTLCAFGVLSLSEKNNYFFSWSQMKLLLASSVAVRFRRKWRKTFQYDFCLFFRLIEKCAVFFLFSF